MPIVFFFVVLLETRSWGACAFYALYILFSSFQFISFQFYSIQRDENYEIKGMKTKYNENYEMLRKKGKCYYNITIAWFFTLKLYTFLYILIMKLLHFFFFFCFVIFVFIRYLWITIFFSEKIVIVRKRFFSIGLFVACFCCILPAVLPHFIRSRWFLRLIRLINIVYNIK